LDSHTLEERVKRDETNAISANVTAKKELDNFVEVEIPTAFAHGVTQTQREHYEHIKRRKRSLQAIEAKPFSCMVEVEVETRDRPIKSSLWYANENSQSNEIIQGENGPITILSWTHPGLQIALTKNLEEEHNIESQGYTLRYVTPLARAKFSQVIPEISGLYEPGGSVRPEAEKVRPKGLRAVKLDMTSEQVMAFISKMDGVMIVSGAPGSGKTTVAFQRVRFLYDQQTERADTLQVTYAPELTRIFLANENLLAYSNKLLVEDLQIPADVVELVSNFVQRYLNGAWVYKYEARLRPRHVSDLERRARQAFFGLCPASDLKGCWQTFEGQIATRLFLAGDSQWLATMNNENSSASGKAQKLADSLASAGQQPLSRDPFGSSMRMDPLFRRVRRDYEDLREELLPGVREKFDEAFHRWLYWVYDPLNALKEYFQANFYEGELRIKRGTAARIQENEVVGSIKSDWERRQYGPEEEPWLAWLLRFVLPEEADYLNRFRMVPWALPAIEEKSDLRWTHVVIDEAQDLSAPEASLLGSLVDPHGAFTISKDFRQVVSPVHGMTDLDAFKIGGSIIEQKAFQQFPFSKNMRQSTQISRFLQVFYEAAFGEKAPFEVSDQFEELKPQLLLGRTALFPNVIRQMTKVTRISGKFRSFALIQINEDEEALYRLRAALEREKVELAPIWEPYDNGGRLVTSSVERIKGLEYDVCWVLGLDDVERTSLTFTTNRAYVALSRPTSRLAILCEEFPRILRSVDRNLFELRTLAS
jgi:hypothetical protein